ncbi:uncharacterized protein LOC111384647 isoform X2 [Olea europaea var. sylvestris]|uniref:uncharacterized protein LOC111384647 isoform X2 n=1 Tax=Olea europaea var. sylvestris TaxID=158386 RepID=UPI000C1CD9BE|nr:uncharacterized protein LOC111384647 isoform X2 [Olea europaea var. sylvestris]
MYCVNVNKLIFKRSFPSAALRIVLHLYGILKLLIALWCHQLFPLKLNWREKKFSIIKMEQSRSHNFVLYNPPDHGNNEHAPESRVFQVDPLGHANASFRSSEVNFSEAKPVHNYSIQTGEEFSLEFMLDRVNPRKPNVPNISGDLSHAPRYLELRGLLGISHTGSESGSDISKISIAEEGSKEFERKNKSHDCYSVQSMQSVPRNSSNWSLMYTSSGASDTSSTKLKILCSFGGKILPRPSDGKLRYVGGETRMIRIRKDITWLELLQKTTKIYNWTHTIKYQLPGEELDALVSVSSDEDLLNMMEECNVLEDGEGSKKLRIFLFSASDLDDAHFTLANSDVDSEIKYVVAVNGMDMGSRKGSVLHGLTNSYGNNLNELDAQNVEIAPNKAANETGVSTSNLAGLTVPSSANISSQSILQGSSKNYEIDLHFDHGQTAHQDDHKQQPLQYGYDLHPPYFSPSESSVPQSSYGLIGQKKDIEGQKLNGFTLQGTKEQEKEVKHKVNSSILPESGNESNKMVTEHLVPSQAYNGNNNIGFPVEELSVVVPKLDREFSTKTLKTDMPQEPLKVSKPLDAVNPSHVPISSGNDYDTCSEALVPESIKSEPDPDLSYFEPPIPQRVFNSERIPRDQGELLSRISKSDDSHSSQLLVNHSRSEVAQQDFINGSDEKEENGNPDILTEQLISTERPFPVDSATRDNFPGKPQRLKQVDYMDVRDPKHENQILAAEAKAGVKLPAESHVDSTKCYEDPTNNLPQVHWVEKVSCESLADNAHEQPEPSAWTGAQEGPSTGVPRTEQVLIDINDRFPRDLLSEIFSKAILSDGSSNISQLQKDGAGLSVNIENHEPKHWSYFQRLAGDGFSRRDVSLMDQDHVGFSPRLPKVEEPPLTYEYARLMKDGPSRSELQDTYGENDNKIIPGGEGASSVVTDFNYSTSRVKASEDMQYDDLMDNTRVRDSDYEIIKNEDLEELRELGSGTFGTVYHGKWRGSDVAIKRIKKSCFTGRQSEQERLTIDFWREAEILSKLHHPNVVAFYGVVQDGPGGTLATVTEYMVDGSLRHVLVRKDRHLDRRKRLIIAMDAAFGMEYLHSKNIVHFDLKCDNLLVNLKDPSRPICKVGDFGLSKIKRNTLVSAGLRGTLPWMAPELMDGSSIKVSEKVDVFSFGIVLWEILTGDEPYANMHYGAIIGGIVSNTLRPTIPSHCDPEWRRLMEQCWAPNPAARPTFTEITNRLRVMSASAQTRKTTS